MKKCVFQKIFLVILASMLVLLLAPEFSCAEKIGWVTDIHAGSPRKKKKSATNVFYPRYYKQYLEQALFEMKSDGANLVIISGDITEKSRDLKYVRRIRSMINEKGMEMVLVRGNHDREKTIEKYMKQKHSYYYLDRYGWRILCLDNAEKEWAKEGGISSRQEKWIKKTLNESGPPVLVVMHYPILKKNDLSSTYKRYRELEGWFSDEQKVKIALSGHWHAEYSATHNDVQYLVGNPLTLESRMGSYYVIDLDTQEIEAKQAIVSLELKKKMGSGKL